MDNHPIPARFLTVGDIIISADPNPRKTRLRVTHHRVLDDGVELRLQYPTPDHHPGRAFKVPFSTTFAREDV